MLDFSWKVFSMTGDVHTYLLLKELERHEHEQKEQNADVTQAIKDTTSIRL